MLLFAGLMNTGQACVAQTRILAPRSRYDEIVEKVGAAVAQMKVGLPDDPCDHRSADHREATRAG